MSQALPQQAALRPYREHPDDDRPQHADRESAGPQAHPQAVRGPHGGHRTRRAASRHVSSRPC